MKQAPHPSGKLLLFNPRWHQYSFEGLTLKSVSKVLDVHFPFNEARVSQFVAKKTGQTPADVVKGWKKQAVLGKNVHAFIESKILNVPPPVILPADVHGEEGKYEPVAISAVENVLLNYDVLGVETMIASPKLGVAGTIDFLGKNKQSGAIFVGDWKTSGATLSSFRFGSFDTPALGSLSHLPNSKFYRYAIQIMIYGYILRHENYSKLFGSEIDTVPIEYGIVQMGKLEDGTVGVQYKEVLPELILPPDESLEVELDSMLHAIITE